jgi:hypothetical protein
VSRDLACLEFGEWALFGGIFVVLILKYIIWFCREDLLLYSCKEFTPRKLHMQKTARPAVGRANLTSSCVSPLYPTTLRDQHSQRLPTSNPCDVATMSGRLVATGALPLARRATVQAVRHYRRLPTGGIQGSDAVLRFPGRRRLFAANAFHNAVIVRNASFARLLPKLVVKFARIPALFGGVVIGGIAWVQYQAIRKFALLARDYLSLTALRNK